MLATLLVDDDRAFSTVAVAALGREGFRADAARSLFEAKRAIAQRDYDFVVLDRRLPDGDGLAWLPELRAAQPEATVILVTAHADIASAVEAVRLGATDYVVKPVELADLIAKAKRAAQDGTLRARLRHVESKLSSRRALVPPRTDVMRGLLDTLGRIATNSPRSPVLLLGETGVGKEVLAWHLHQRTFGEAAPFIQINCAALPEAMAESELFGHERGAFTDAKRPRPGLVELSDGGTLFLDEVGELSAALQAKLLTFLDGGHFRRLGGVAELTSSARVIAATNQDLAARVKVGAFREDLWFRLSVFALRVPPLRERLDDLRPLSDGLLARLAAEQGRRAVPRLSDEGLQRLARCAFPGNVRELRGILERATVLEAADELHLRWLHAELAPPAAEGFHVASVATIDELERAYARWALGQLGGRRLETAKALGISHPTLAKLLRDAESA